MTRYFKSAASDLNWKFSTAGNFVRIERGEWLPTATELAAMQTMVVETDANGERLNEPDADRITLSDLDGFAAVLDGCRSTVRRVRLRAESGEIHPGKAAAVCAEVVETVSNYFRP